MSTWSLTGVAKASDCDKVRQPLGFGCDFGCPHHSWHRSQCSCEHLVGFKRLLSTAHSSCLVQAWIWANCGFVVFPGNLRVRIRVKVGLRLRLELVLGMYGLYYRCMDCTGNTWIVQICSLCTTYICGASCHALFNPSGTLLNSCIFCTFDAMLHESTSWL